MTAALEGGEWSAARPGHTLLPRKIRYPLYMKLGGPQSRPGRAENLAPTDIRSRTVHRCTSVSNLFISEWHSTCFGRSFRPSSAVQDCTYSNKHLSNKCLLLYVQSWTADDGRKDRPKHVEYHSKINKFDTPVRLVGFTIGIILRCTALWRLWSC